MSLLNYRHVISHLTLKDKWDSREGEGNRGRQQTEREWGGVDLERESDFIKAISRPSGPAFPGVLLFDKEISK